MHPSSEFHGNKFSFREERRIASSTNYRSNPGLTQLGVSPDKDPTDQNPGPTALIEPGLTTTQERKTEREKKSTEQQDGASPSPPHSLRDSSRQKAGEKQRGKGVGTTYMMGCGRRGESDNEQKEMGKQGERCRGNAAAESPGSLAQGRLGEQHQCGGTKRRRLGAPDGGGRGGGRKQRNKRGWVVSPVEHEERKRKPDDRRKRTSTRPIQTPRLVVVVVAVVIVVRRDQRKEKIVQEEKEKGKNTHTPTTPPPGS